MSNLGSASLPMASVEILVVENGYCLRRGSMSNHFTGDDGTYVFETYESLIAWMKENLSKPGDNK